MKISNIAWKNNLFFDLSSFIKKISYFVRIFFFLFRFRWPIKFCKNVTACVHKVSIFLWVFIFTPKPVALHENYSFVHNIHFINDHCIKTHDCKKKINNSTILVILCRIRFFFVFQKSNFEKNHAQIKSWTNIKLKKSSYL